MAVTHGPGFRFHPTDQELVIYYLKRKLTGKIPLCYDYIGDVDIYKFEPWDLPSLSKLKSGDLEWFFFTLLDKKYGNGSRTNRATDRGFWKTTGNDRAVKQGERTVGMKKTLVYHSGRAPHGTRTNWVMHEYRLVNPLIQGATVQDATVLCRIFEKSGSGPKNGESHGAPFREADWANADDEGVHPVPAVADENHLNQLPPEVALVGYIEQEDLEQKLEPSTMIGNAGFHYGECSSHPKHSQVFVNNQEPLGGSSGISDLRNGHPVLNNGDHGELSHEDTPLNFNDPIQDLDLLSWDPSDYSPIVDNENYFEGMDLVMNLGEVNPAEANSSVTEMLNEYITFSDEDDISKYISYSPQSIGSESPIPDQGPPFIQQNVEGETNDISLASKHVFEAQSSNEASLELNPQASELVSGDTNPVVKQANKWLASIPAAPAFASEFPTKEFTLGLHPAAQSSNSAHVTAGMISITDITLRGNVMDWRVGKNGGFDPIMSTGFSQPGVYSAALMPISGLVSRKTAFMLSHGWIFLMGFSVLILSLSFKIGSFMHTGK